MTVATRQRRRLPGERREALLAAASELFIAPGIEATTVEDITARAGVAKGTFYVYFPSKAALLAALRAGYLARIRSWLDSLELPVRREDWRAFTLALVRDAIDRQLETRALHDLVTFTPHEHDEEHEAALAGLRSSLARIIRAGVAARALSVEDVETTAGIVFELVHASATRAAHNKRQASAIVDATAVAAWRVLSGTP